MGCPVDVEVARAVAQIAHVLAGMGHVVEEATPEFDGLRAMRSMMDVWYFGFDQRLEGYSKRSGHPIGHCTAYRRSSRPSQPATSFPGGRASIA